LLVPVHATLFYPLQQQKSWWRNWRYAKETISKLGRFGRSNSSNYLTSANKIYSCSDLIYSCYI
jgi:hypothetical protein